jgi:hypothetical protein
LQVAGMGRWIFKSLLLLFVLAGFLGSLILLGQLALDQVRKRERYLVAFADIECQPPPGMSRAAFLDEVQYLAALPQHCNLLDDGLSRSLTEGFQHHPWVKKVQKVDILPTRQVRVELLLRRPVLAVATATGLRAVDDDGVLLPSAAATADLPRFQGQARPPAGAAGAPWGDAAVEAKARSFRKMSNGNGPESNVQ